MLSSTIPTLLLLLATSTYTSADQCACATEYVHVRDGVGTSATILYTLPTHDCLPFKGNRQPDSYGADWVNVDFSGADSWIHENYVTIEACPAVNVQPTPAVDDCACATTNVHIRDGIGTNSNILTTLTTHHCVPFEGDRGFDSSDASWVHVNYNGQSGWIHENYVDIKPCSQSGSTGGSGSPSGSNPNLPGCPHIVTRAEWGARAPSTQLSQLPATPKYMFLHHGASSACFNKADCIAKVQGYQNYHMDGHGWSDIGYSFVVGEDGNVYEARGWDSVGAHTKGYNSVGLAICVIGDFTDYVPNDLALNAVKGMIQCAADNGKIVNDYILKGHRDVGTTACPGTSYYELIQTWPHYTLNRRR